MFKSSLVIAAAILAAVAIYIYNTPFNQCLRANANSYNPTAVCGNILHGN